jgi:hypothetical protein
VSSKEVRFMANATRLLPVLRRKVQASPAKSVRTLVETVSQALAPSNATRKLLLTQLETLAATLPAEKADAEAGKEDDPMDAEEPADKKAKEKRSMLPETEMYVGLVVLMFLIDSKATEAALACSKVLCAAPPPTEPWPSPSPAPSPSPSPLPPPSAPLTCSISA